MNIKFENLYSNVGILCWIAIGIRTLFPIPLVISGVITVDAVVDIVWWIFFCVLTSLGVWSSIKLRNLTLKPALVFAVVSVLYVLHRCFFLQYVYMGYWSDILSGTPLKTIKMLWNISPFAPINSLIFDVLIPISLIVVSAWFIKNNRNEMGTE